MTFRPPLYKTESVLVYMCKSYFSLWKGEEDKGRGQKQEGCQDEECPVCVQGWVEEDWSEEGDDEVASPVGRGCDGYCNSC